MNLKTVPHNFPKEKPQNGVIMENKKKKKKLRLIPKELSKSGEICPIM